MAEVKSLFVAGPADGRMMFTNPMIEVLNLDCTPMPDYSSLKLDCNDKEVPLKLSVYRRKVLRDERGKEFHVMHYENSENTLMEDLIVGYRS